MLRKTYEYEQESIKQGMDLFVVIAVCSMAEGDQMKGGASMIDWWGVDINSTQIVNPEEKSQAGEHV
jgi:hypothetical protein